MLKIGISGASGKVGTTISTLIAKNTQLYQLTSKISSKNNMDDLEILCSKAEVIIDFSSPILLEKILDINSKYKTPMVIGTTGLNAAQLNFMQESSSYFPIIYSANMTIGANLQKLVAAKIALALNDEYDIEILEMHHRFKKDAPSGTAIEIAKEISNAKNLDFEKVTVYDMAARRIKNQIGIASLRGGSMQGEHNVIFAGNSEVIEIKHRVLDREVYGEGALKAANWIVKQKTGLYSMIDVLDIKI